MAQKQKYETINIRGTLVYPYLHKTAVDSKFPADEYQTKIRTKVTPEVQKIIDRARAMAEAKMAEFKAELAEKIADTKGAEKKKNMDLLANLKLSLPFTFDVDDDGNEIDSVVFKGKLKRVFVGKDGKKVINKPVIAAASGKTLENPPAIWGGTEAIVQFLMGSYATNAGLVGVNLRIKGAQILKLVSGGAGEASFGAVEGFEDIEDGNPFGDETPKAPEAEGSGDEEEATNF